MIDTAQAATGKWKGILLQMGLDRKFLSPKHGPCPLCGGVDRFRWDNKEGRGSYICGGCGAGSGFDLVMKFKGLGFKEAAKAIDEICGNVKADPVKREMDDEKKKLLLRELWAASKPITAGDLVTRYFSARGLFVDYFAPDLRFVENCPAPDGIKRPAMIAMVRDIDGKPCNIHRTFLKDGGKADMDNPRAMMPGTLPPGACIRLSPVAAHIGIAEGTETAYGAMGRFSFPVWSAINATVLAKWDAPVGVEAVTVFGDNDAKFGGQAAAYTVAHRLAVNTKRNLRVDVNIPIITGKDYGDAT